jgi:serine/threonine protein kinase
MHLYSTCLFKQRTKSRHYTFKSYRSPAMEIEIPLYFPKSVHKLLAVGGNSFIGLVDEATVFKYPRIPGDKSAIASLDIEARIYKAIGPHARIIGFQGQSIDGLFIDYAPHGSLARYLVENEATTQQRLRWSCQATEAIAVIHSKRVIHCDIKAQNLLLDIELNVKLCDFQGRLLKSSGELDCDGGSSENPKFFMPRNSPEHTDPKTDIFALGSTIFHIVEGHEPFPGLDPFLDEEEITARFSAGLFPEPRFSPIRDVVHKCWSAKYVSADEVLWEVQQLCRDR